MHPLGRQAHSVPVSTAATATVRAQCEKEGDQQLLVSLRQWLSVSEWVGLCARAATGAGRSSRGCAAYCKVHIDAFRQVLVRGNSSYLSMFQCYIRALQEWSRLRVRPVSENLMNLNRSQLWLACGMRAESERKFSWLLWKSLGCKTYCLILFLLIKLLVPDLQFHLTTYFQFSQTIVIWELSVVGFISPSLMGF